MAEEKKNDWPEIKYLFEPRSVAVIGASDNRSKIGCRVLENILYSRYPGKVYPVNPKGGEILGLETFTSITDVSGEVDMAVIVIPHRFVFRSIKDCTKKGVKFGVIITSGFSEVGNIQCEREIVDYANAHGMRILGPNIFGVYSSMAPINATFGPKEVSPGNVALITQSGALGIAMFGKTKVENIGLSAVISVGNKSDIDEGELLDYLARDECTRVILMYMEGVTNGEGFVESLKRITRKKPVVIIKSGRSKRGAMAAASHTGSLAGADEVFDDVMRQCGVLRAESVQEALDWCKFLSNSPLPKGDRTVIVTNGGGIGVMATDACEKFGVDLYDDLITMQELFNPVTPEFGSVKNPVDITGQASAEDYRTALEASMESPKVDSVVCLGCETALFDSNLVTSTIEDIYERYYGKKPMVFSFLGGGEMERGIAEMRKKGIPVFSDVYDSISCLGKLYTQYRNTLAGIYSINYSLSEEDKRIVSEVLDSVQAKRRKFLLPEESGKLMEIVNMPVPRSRIARDLHQIIKYSREIGFPVVMKVVSKDIIHKSDSGGVALDLENVEEVIDAYEAIMFNCRKSNPSARIEGVEISEMVSTGVEMIVGARRDASFGPVVMVGLGGIYVEVMKDICFRALPVDRKEAILMIEDMHSYPLLMGVRGEGRKDVDGIVDTLIKLGKILLADERITDIEINPLETYDQGKGVKAVDVRILISGL